MCRAAMSRPSTPTFSVNDRSYTPPRGPVAVICIDGCDDEYLTVSMDEGRMPNLEALSGHGYRGLARGALPSFTNVNNAAIVTGVPPSVTGIGGNYFLDPDTGEEVMMNSASYLRVDTILFAAARSGRAVAMVTAKEKLRDLLARDLDGIAFSAEYAGLAAGETHGIDDVETIVGAPTPSIYSPEASLFVLQAGAALIEQKRADFLYLSLTDYMQHTYAPDADESLAFHESLDHEIGRLLEAGAVLGITADHGMNAKVGADGSPRVIYLETLLQKHLDDEGVRVICPITDPYVVHHGALGSAVTVYLPEAACTDEVAAWIMSLDGVTEVHDRARAAEVLELPGDRIGDLYVLSDRNVVLGRAPEYHDLSALEGSLRSHGGRFEETVPMLLSEPLDDTYRSLALKDPRNFDIFDFTCNGGAA